MRTQSRIMIPKSLNEAIEKGLDNALFCSGNERAVIESIRQEVLDFMAQHASVLVLSMEKREVDQFSKLFWEKVKSSRVA